MPRFEMWRGSTDGEFVERYEGGVLVWVDTRRRVFCR
jgi:hypothetical protein